MEIAAILLLAALAIDLVLGEPPLKLHPVAWMGNFIKFLRGEGRGRAYGLVLLLGTLLFSWSLIFIPLFSVRIGLPYLIYLLWSVYLLKTSFSFKLMRSYAKRIAESAEAGDLERARAVAQEIVRRDLKNSDAGHIISAAIESLAESEVDGLTSPIFYYPIGLIGPISQRAINTLDSMVGYAYEPYDKVGWASAKLDTIVNYLPARLTVLFISAGALIVGLNWKRAIKTAVRFHKKTKSVNGGWPMSSIAGALGVRLEKEGEYSLGYGELPQPFHLRKALKVFDTSFLLFLLIWIIILLVI